MGYTLTAIVIEPDELHAAIGSGDRKLLDRVLRMFPDDFDEDDYDEKFDGVTDAEALRQLILGDGGKHFAGGCYGYAFEAIAKALGRVTFADRFDPGSSGIAEILSRPFVFPISTDGFPQLGWLPIDEVKSEISRVENEEGSDDSLLHPWMNTLRTAIDSGCGVLLTRG